MGKPGPRIRIQILRGRGIPHLNSSLGASTHRFLDHLLSPGQKPDPLSMDGFSASSIGCFPFSRPSWRLVRAHPHRLPSLIIMSSNFPRKYLEAGDVAWLGKCFSSVYEAMSRLNPQGYINWGMLVQWNFQRLAQGRGEENKKFRATVVYLGLLRSA